MDKLVPRGVCHTYQTAIKTQPAQIILESCASSLNINVNIVTITQAMDHDELEQLEQYIRETEAKFRQRRELRLLNVQTNIDYSETDDESGALAKLDSSIKKNSAFVKRLKVFSESQKDQILEEIDKLNSTKFISEIASSLIEAKLKLSDIPSVIEICTKLNRTYKEFHKHLIEQYLKYFPQVIKRKHHAAGDQGGSGGILHQSSSHNTLVLVSSPGSSSSSNLTGVGSLAISGSSGNLVKSASTRASSSNDNLTIPILNPSKLRVDLRLLAEFILNGVIPLKDGFLTLMNLLYYLIVHDKMIHQNANAILTFCKGCGDEYLGLVPKSMEDSAAKYGRDLPTSDFITLKRQALIRSFMHDYFQSLVRHIGTLHNELGQLVARNKKICKLKGEMSKELKEQVEVKHAEFQKARNVLTQLANILGEEAPEFAPLESTVESIIAETVELSNLDKETSTSASGGISIWDDDGTRSFYEDLLDLRALFPNLPIKAPSLKSKKPEDSTSSNKDGGGGSPELPESGEIDKDRDSSSSSTESLNTADDEQTSASLQMTKSVADRRQPDQYFAKLSDCVNRDMIDNAAIDFIKFFNSKFGRKKLLKTLFNVHRTRLDLLPFFARLTATTHPYVPSVGNELVSQLRHEFKNLFKKKDQINIESKVKNVRFIGELVKFNLYPKREALDCLKSLLSDFTHHHIEMTCNLLEVCGRMLYKTPESHHQMRLILEQMMRKKMLLTVDSKYVTMIENAYYFTNPPEITRHVVEESPVNSYIKYLLYECLNRSTIDKVVKKIKLLNWADKKLATFTINCLIEVHNIKFYNIRYLAALLAALNKDHQWIGIAVVDGVVEDILLMLEINEVQFNQRRIPMIRYFGELYNYRLSDSSLVLKILYSLITYGVPYPEPTANLPQIQLSPLDPPDNLYRIKLVCDLLDTSGQYLSSAQEKRKLDCYLLFFQRYYWCKRHIFLLHPYCLAKSSNQFPASTEYLYNDTIRNLRPTFKMVESYAEATRTLQIFIDSLQTQQPQTSAATPASTPTVSSSSR